MHLREPRLPGQKAHVGRGRAEADEEVRVRHAAVGAEIRRDEVLVDGGGREVAGGDAAGEVDGGADDVGAAVLAGEQADVDVVGRGARRGGAEAVPEKTELMWIKNVL